MASRPERHCFVVRRPFEMNAGTRRWFNARVVARRFSSNEMELGQHDYLRHNLRIERRETKHGVSLRNRSAGFELSTQGRRSENQNASPPLDRVSLRHIFRLFLSGSRARREETRAIEEQSEARMPRQSPSRSFREPGGKRSRALALSQIKSCAQARPSQRSDIPQAARSCP